MGFEREGRQVVEGQDNERHKPPTEMQAFSIKQEIFIFYKKNAW